MKINDVANVTAIPNGAPSPDSENFCPISITPIQSKKLVSHKLSNFAKNMLFSLLLSLLIGKVLAALIHC